MTRLENLIHILGVNVHFKPCLSSPVTSKPTNAVNVRQYAIGLFFLVSRRRVNLRQQRKRLKLTTDCLQKKGKSSCSFCFTERELENICYNNCTTVLALRRAKRDDCLIFSFVGVGDSTVCFFTDRSMQAKNRAAHLPVNHFVNKPFAMVKHDR
ncbi:hypothetical protein T4D_179 [Trichinella pseudospiralis]|uniref:Uncharacterized protein n=1 Tax=Trichinella pseudospiralis TaxID=6337 RepID=A0A0V1FJ54_TRIPS|nr:hypothetical protein T4D_179 [Trichinella pseudospiralis]